MNFRYSFHFGLCEVFLLNIDFQVAEVVDPSEDVWGGSSSLACEALLLHSRSLVFTTSPEISTKYDKYPRFSDVQVLWISKDGIQKILNPYGAENLHKKDGIHYDYIWIIVLLVITIWMCTCTQCIIFCATSPTSEVAFLTLTQLFNVSDHIHCFCIYWMIVDGCEVILSSLPKLFPSSKSWFTITFTLNFSRVLASVNLFKSYNKLNQNPQPWTSSQQNTNSSIFEQQLWQECSENANFDFEELPRRLSHMITKGATQRARRVLARWSH